MQVADRLETNILIVDDHPANLVALEAVLEPLGQRVVKADSGKAALKHLLHEDFACILLDVQMPDLDGFETAALIKGREQSRHIPILFLTALDRGESHILRGYAEGAVDYVVKPFDADILRTKVRVFVELHLKAEALKCREEALRVRERADAEARRADLYGLLMQAPSPVCVQSGPELVYEFVNPAYRQLVGVRRELLGKPIREALPELESQGVLERLDAVYATGVPFVVEEHPIRFDRNADRTLEEGVYRYVIQPLKDAGGHVTGLAQFAYEITEQVQARRRAEESEERLRLATEVSAVGIWELSLDGQTAWRSELHDRAFGYTSPLSEWSFDTFLSHVHPEDREWVGAAMAQAMEMQEAFNLEFQVVWPDGTLHWMAVRGQVQQDGAGRPAKVVGTNIDITARKRIERNLEEAVRLRDEFLSVASHELKTPLTPLALRLSQLKRDISGIRTGQRSGKREMRNLEIAEKQVKKLAALVDDLLDVTRLSSGRMRLEPEPVDLSELVREVASRFEPEAARAGCRLEVCAERPAVGNWDRIRLEQVVTNLVSNALKYGAGRPIHFTVESGEEGAWLVVRDEGIGIDPGALERIFEKFERAVSERHYGGLGLGLYVTRQIVEALGGTVKAESALGEGATFTVALPLAGARAGPSR